MSKRILILLLIITLAILTFCTKKTTTPEEQLLPPTNITISLVENNKIQINWIDNSTNETAYFIDRKMATYYWLENFGEVDANITSFTDNIPTNSDTVFSYRIRAYDEENYSAYSDTIAWFSINSAPSNLELEQIAQDSIKLTWQDNSIGEEYFRIDRKIDEKGWQMDYAHVPADTTHFLDYTTALYDTCNYKIFAVSGISYSDSTENAFIPFLPAPNNLELQALSATEVKLTWKDNCHNEEGYRLFIKRGETAVWDSLNLTENTETYSDEDVIPGIMNYYNICAYYENDTSGFIEDEINTLPAPNNLICTQRNVHTFELTWNDNSEFEQGFKIDRKIDFGDWVNGIGVTVPNATTWIDSTVGRNFNTVYYRLYAYYEAYTSDSIETNSNIAFPAPKNLEYEKLTIQSIKLTWEDYSQGETGFNIDKKVGVGIGEWQIQYAIVGENIQEWTDENAEINDNLMYRIHAYCGNNVSDYATSQQIDNTFPAPTDISYQKIDIATIKLTWTDNSVGEQGFKIDKKVGEEDWEIEYAALNADIVQWLDWTAEINEIIQYRVYAYYEDAVSGYAITDEIDNTIPAPSNLDYEILSPTSVKLTWDDNSIGEQGFKIDKKLGDGEWQNEYAVLDDNITEWIDENVDFINNYYTYRIHSYFAEYQSPKQEIEIFNTFTKTFGGLAGDGGYSVEQTNDGGFIITGYTQSYGAGEGDVWLIKTDAIGNEEWNNTFGGIDHDEGYSIEQTNDGGFIIIGYTASYGVGSRDVWLIKTDVSGNEEWNRTFGGSEFDEGKSVKQTTDGGYILTGYKSYISGNKYLWLIKTDNEGHEEWNKTFGENEGNRGWSVSQTYDGGFIVTGDTYTTTVEGYIILVKTDENGNEEWIKTFGGHYGDIGCSVEQTTDGNFVISGNRHGLTGNTAYLLKTDEMGNKIWDNFFPGSTGTSVKETEDGGFVFSVGYNFVIIKADYLGNQLWCKILGSIWQDYVSSVCQTMDGGFAITGRTESYGAGYRDVWLIKTDDEGNVE